MIFLGRTNERDLASGSRHPWHPRHPRRGVSGAGFVLTGTSTCMRSSSLNRTFSFHVTVPSSSASLNRFRFSMSTCPSLVRPLSAARTRWYQSSRSSSGSPTCSLSTIAPTCCAVAPRKDPSSPARSSASSRGSPPPPPPTPTPVPRSMGTATPRASSSRLWSAADTIRR